jgi:hypothetical protein
MYDIFVKIEWTEHSEAFYQVNEIGKCGLAHLWCDACSSMAYSLGTERQNYESHLRVARTEKGARKDIAITPRGVPGRLM